MNQFCLVESCLYDFNWKFNKEEPIELQQTIHLIKRQVLFLLIVNELLKNTKTNYREIWLYVEAIYLELTHDYQLQVLKWSTYCMHRLLRCQWCQCVRVSVMRENVETLSDHQIYFSSDFHIHTESNANIWGKVALIQTSMHVIFRIDMHNWNI